MMKKINMENGNDTIPTVNSGMKVISNMARRRESGKFMMRLASW
jgi:hypothetical protein